MYLFLVFLQGVLLFASGIFFSLRMNMLDGSKADIQHALLCTGFQQPMKPLKFSCLSVNDILHSFKKQHALLNV
ncbi:hypothetical protein DXA38_01165 [[Clostridium] innocuum]|uniref:Uncharacterized protein n=1 Tax=Clostridium innocuum TaxID=1522 RepID=A0A3E2W4F8_CLOIN|nr:hypothetical protein DXA38_01165 [[Clostridium] innocuum]RHV69382.1 hypothetical protein DXB22_00470 [Clostridiaceae bacterium OM02-2AC]